MTADLVARLEIAAKIHDDMTGKGNAMAATIREAASALRSSGEAVACTVNGYLPRQRAVELLLDSDVPEWITKNPGIRAYLSATPASAWRPIAEAPRDGTQILGYWPDRGCHAVAFCSDGWWRRAQDEGALTPPVLWQSITPPTSTKA